MPQDRRPAPRRLAACSRWTRPSLDRSSFHRVDGVESLPESGCNDVDTARSDSRCAERGGSGGRSLSRRQDDSPQPIRSAPATSAASGFCGRDATHRDARRGLAQRGGEHPPGLGSEGSRRRSPVREVETQGTIAHVVFPCVDEMWLDLRYGFWEMPSGVDPADTAVRLRHYATGCSTGRTASRRTTSWAAPSTPRSPGTTAFPVRRGALPDHAGRSCSCATSARASSNAASRDEGPSR